MPKIDGMTYDELCRDKPGFLYYKDIEYPNEPKFCKLVEYYRLRYKGKKL